MFKTKTVASAIAPFQKVVSNLRGVIAAQDDAANTAQIELNSAREHFISVEAEKTATMESAAAEKARAEKLMAKLEALLADDDA